MLFLICLRIVTIITLSTAAFSSSLSHCKESYGLTIESRYLKVDSDLKCMCCLDSLSV